MGSKALTSFHQAKLPGSHQFFVVLMAVAFAVSESRIQLLPGAFSKGQVLTYWWEVFQGGKTCGKRCQAQPPRTT
jgi:hypothetical protein